MTENKFYCDRCGKLVSTSDYTHVSVEISHLREFTVDICNDCLDKFYIMLSNFIKPEAESSDDL